MLNSLPTLVVIAEKNLALPPLTSTQLCFSLTVGITAPEFPKLMVSPVFAIPLEMRYCFCFIYYIYIYIDIDIDT